MEVLDEIQQSIAWHSHRRSCWNASDIPAIMGVSPYKSRSEFMHEIATGISPDHDEQTLARFSEGHRSESLARPLMEKIIGQRVFPVIGYTEEFALSRPLSASFDALVMDETEGGEHKSLNAEIQRVFASDEPLPELYTVQMEVQCMVSGARRMLFMASKWNGDELAEELHRWYEPNPELRERVLQSIRQFEADLANYTPPEYIPAAVASPTKDLPALSIQVQGSITLIDNLSLFGAMLKDFIEQIDKEPTDDQGFADAEDAVKKLQTAQDALEAAEASALAQTASIDEMRRTVKLYADQARTTRLMLEKMVKARKEQLRADIVREGRDAYDAHILTLNIRLKKPYLSSNAKNIPEPNFAGVIKGKKTIASLREAVNNELVRVKLESNSVADKVEINLNSLREMAKDHAFLFADIHQLILKANDDLVTLIRMRISDHEKAEAARIEKIKEDARIEAEAKAADVFEAARLKAEQDQRAKSGEATHAEGERAPMPQSPTASSPPYQSVEAINAKRKAAGLASIQERPTDDQIISTISWHYGVAESVATGWLATFDADAAIERISEREAV